MCVCPTGCKIHAHVLYYKQTATLAPLRASFAIFARMSDPFLDKQNYAESVASKEMDVLSKNADSHPYVQDQDIQESMS